MVAMKKMEERKGTDMTPDELQQYDNYFTQLA
jgi:hypothetical protein